jgi:predicted nucleic acid-binding protein
MIVVDASVLIELVLRSKIAPSIEKRLFAQRQVLVVPHLVDVEVAQVLRRFAAKGELGEERGRQAHQDLADLPLARFAHEPLLQRVWQLRHNVTAYDATYIALAESLDVPLVTRDAKLAASTGHDAEVELI